MEGSPSDPGIAPRAVSELFRIIEEISSDWTYRVSFSMLEIYNENIFDLLAADRSSRERDKLDIRQTPEGNTVPGLMEHVVSMSQSLVSSLIERGRWTRPNRCSS
jgi:hypothetical protein